MISNKSSKFLRFIGILLVIASHYAGWMYVEPKHLAAKEWVSTLGPYGVDIFFLLSGYGLYKSAAHSKGVGLVFVIKRIFGVYVPYLLMVLSIHLIEGSLGEFGVKEWQRLLIGYEFWYMNIQFIFYILFMVIWQMKEHLRLAFITIGVIVTSVIMYRIGRADFWIISNLSFLIGIYAAYAEGRWRKAFESRIAPIILCILAIILMILMVHGPLQNLDFGEDTEIITKTIYNTLFSVAVLGIAYLIPQWQYLPVHIGTNSLFIYILHQYIFWQLTIPFANMDYAAMAVCIGIITLVVCVAIGSLYQAMLMWLYRGLNIQKDRK